MKQLRSLLCLCLVAAMVLGMAACGEEKEPEIAGYYVLESAVVDGETLSAEDLAWRDYDLFVRLYEDSTAVFFNGAEIVEATYRNGELLVSEGENMLFAVKGRKLTLTTVEGELVFRRATIGEPDLQELRDALDIPPEVGYFKFDYATDGSKTYSAEDLGAEHEMFLLLEEDGTGVMCAASTLVDMGWKDGKIYPAEDPDDAAAYTVEGDCFEIEQDGITMYFERSNETPPDIAELREELAPKLPGYYLMTAVYSNGKTTTVSDMASQMETKPFLLVNEDGTAVMFDGLNVYDMAWDDEHFWYDMAASEKLEYLLKTDMLTIGDDKSYIEFERSDETPPDIDALRNEKEGELYAKYELYAFDMGSGMTEASSGTYLILYTDGSGLYDFGSGTMNVAWNEEQLAVGTVIYTYEANADGTLEMTGSDGTFCFRLVEEGSGEATEEWYGFWIMTDCTGKMEEYDDMWWDLCARVSSNGDGSYTMVLWDEDYNSINDPIGEIIFEIRDGDYDSTEGWFYMDEFTDELKCIFADSPTEDMLYWKGTYSDTEGSYTYELYLRPWGTDWSDLDDDWMPYYYESWYLPLIEAGASLPDTFEIPD